VGGLLRQWQQVPATDSNGYKQYNPTVIRYRMALFLHSTPHVELESLTSNFLPVDIHKDAHNTTIIINRTNGRRRPTTRVEITDEEGNWEKCIMENLEITDKETFVQLCNSDRDFYITSNGGIYESQVTFGTIISDKVSPVVIIYGKLYTHNLYESSYRSEAYGMLAGLALQKSLKIQNTEQTKAKNILYCVTINH
jgi:hypothetical protein